MISEAGDDPREGIVKDVAGVTIVACVDVVMDAERDKEGVEERGGVEIPDAELWDVGCGFRLMKGSLRPGCALVSDAFDDDPVVLSRGVWTCSGGRGVDVGVPERATLILGLGEFRIDVRDFLRDKLFPLLVLLALTAGLFGSVEDGPRPREGLPCPFREVSGPLRRSGFTP